MVIWIRQIRKHLTDASRRGNPALTTCGNVFLRTATETLLTTTALFQVKQFILYHTLIKSTTETHTEQHSLGHVERMGIMGFLARGSWLSRAGS